MVFFSQVDVRESITNILSHGDKIPKRIKYLLRKHKNNLIKDNNGFMLTPRQYQILNLIISRGASNKTISKILNIAESTVKLHISAILKKYGVQSRTQLAVFCKK